MRAGALMAAAVLAGLPASALAHDFWLQPERFQVAPAAAGVVVPMVGHGTEQRASALPLRRVTRFEAASSDGRPAAGLQALEPAVGGLRAGFAFDRPGTYALRLETDTGAVGLLSAARFNAHVARAGLTPAAIARAGRTR